VIVDSVAVSQATDDAAGPLTQGQRVAWCACLLHKLLPLPNSTVWWRSCENYNPT